jgi:predicted amidohydrolase YtcJ
MGRKEALEAMESQLRAKPPEGLSSLSEEELEDLTDAIREARRRQAAELHAAGERALDHIPWLLRSPIRKVMGG